MGIICKEKLVSKDGTIKYIFQNATGLLFEAVYFQFCGVDNRKQVIVNSICLSSQVGCSVNCTFCATGQGGFFSNLTCEDMLEEVNLIQKDLKNSKLPLATNCGFKGMGEPLLNYSEVVKFCKIIKNICPTIKRVSLSTVGIVPRLKKLVSDNAFDCKLYISLHAPTSSLRNRIIPINKKYPIKKVLAVAKKYAVAKEQKVILSYLLIKNFNASQEHAKQLVKLISKDSTFFDIQLLPLNPCKNMPWKRPSKKEVTQFKAVLDQGGLFSYVQVSKGTDITAGCGQLVKDGNINLIKTLAA